MTPGSRPAVVIHGTRASWQSGTADVDLDFAATIAQWLVDETSERIAFLCRESSGASFIAVHRADGSFLRRFIEPKDVSFNYLGPSRGHSLAVMATAYHGGWGDWWYGLEPDTDQLVSLGEGR